MTYPPPPGGPPPSGPPPAGPPPGGPPPAGPPPPPHGNPYPPQGYPDPQQPWPPQQHWPAGPPPKKRGTGWKWGLGIVAVLAVIAVTAAVTISVTKDSGEGATSPSGETFGLASADDTGPANIITEEPTCAAWLPINQAFSDIAENGWNDRDPSIAADDWTREQRASYLAVAKVLGDSANQTVALAKRTPHRVMRELYEQFIAYSRAYSEAIATYGPEDDFMAQVVNSSSTVLADVCAAIDWRSAQARAPLVSDPSPPDSIAPIVNPNEPQRFVTSGDSTCTDWVRVGDQLDADTREWQELDPNIPASGWNPEQRAVVEVVIPIMDQHADEVEAMGRMSENPILGDIAVLSAQYRRAYAAALPSYTSADFYLAEAAAMGESMIRAACKAVGA